MDKVKASKRNHLQERILVPVWIQIIMVAVSVGAVARAAHELALSVGAAFVVIVMFAVACNVVQR